jgi:SnoaL-like domain
MRRTGAESTRRRRASLVSMDETDDVAILRRNVDVLMAHREIEQKIFRMGYALEDGDFDAVGSLLRHATFGADMIGRRVFRGQAEITSQYERTNITYPGKGRATREMYDNVVIDIDLDAGTARSTTMYTVAQQVPGSDEPFALLVAGRYVDEWAVIEGEWHFTDRFIEVQFKNDLNRHMQSGSQPYN